MRSSFFVPAATKICTISSCRPLYAGLRAQDFLPTKILEETMTTPLTFPDHLDKAFDRRNLLKGAAALAATAATASPASARDYGPNAEPQRYPDSDILVL